MDFRKLSFFEAVCRLHSFTKASEELHVTQPSVTIAIQNLEEELQVVLLNRYRGGFTLTPEGEFLYEKSQLLLKELEDITHMLRASASSRMLTLRIGYSVQMREAFLPFLKNFQSVYPNIKIIENESSTPSIAKQIEEGAMDFGIVVTTKEITKNMVVYPLFEGELRVCAGKDSRICSLDHIDLETFEKQPLIALSLNEPRNSYIFNVLQEAYPEQKINLKPLFSSLQLHSYFQMIQHNDGIGLTYHDKWFHMHQYSSELPGFSSCVEIPFYPPCFYTVALIRLKEKPVTKVQETFIRHLKSSL